VPPFPQHYCSSYGDSLVEQHRKRHSDFKIDPLPHIFFLHISFLPISSFLSLISSILSSFFLFLPSFLFFLSFFLSFRPFFFFLFYLRILTCILWLVALTSYYEGVYTVQSANELLRYILMSFRNFISGMQDLSCSQR